VQVQGNVQAQTSAQVQGNAQAQTSVQVQGNVRAQTSVQAQGNALWNNPGAAAVVHSVTTLGARPPLATVNADNRVVPAAPVPEPLAVLVVVHSAAVVGAGVEDVDQ
jgi:hypothetical protein